MESRDWQREIARTRHAEETPGEAREAQGVQARCAETTPISVGMIQLSFAGLTKGCRGNDYQTTVASRFRFILFVILQEGC
jgi:hypothetical protein